MNNKTKKSATPIIIAVTEVAVIAVVSVFIIICNNWRIINLADGKYDGKLVELDLDGDGKNETVETKVYGKYITINDEDFVVNDRYPDDDPKITDPLYRTLSDYKNNSYRIIDLNSDGILEIIHNTSASGISPTRNRYTLFNYKNHSLHEIDSFSITGNISETAYTNGSAVKFVYSEYESDCLGSPCVKEIIIDLNK